MRHLRHPLIGVVRIASHLTLRIGARRQRAICIICVQSDSIRTGRPCLGTGRTGQPERDGIEGESAILRGRPAAWHIHVRQVVRVIVSIGRQQRPRRSRRRGSSIHRQAISLAAALGEKKPSYPVVWRIVRALPAGLVTLAHQGSRAYSESFDLVHRREASKPNAMWQVDHAQLNMELLCEGGSTAKPWLTIVLDDYSRAVAGYYLGFEPPSSLRTALALRQGMWRKGDPHWEVCGIPDVLYTDNGADFTSKHIEQVAIDLKMRLVFSTPGKPQGRGRIERFFRTVNEMFLCDLDGYTQRPGRAPTFTLGQLDKLFRAFLLETYHRRPSSEGKPSPKERWEAGGFLPRMPDSLEQLDLLLLHEVRSRRVRPDGIHFHNFRYLSLTLAAYVGEEVTIRFDPRDMGEIRVFYQNRFLCPAISADLAGQTIPLRDIVRARNRRRNELRTLVRSRQRTIDTLLELKRDTAREDVHASTAVPAESRRPRLKRYYNE